MNYARILQTNIPDLAPVYGGARGRTMSSRHQLYAWQALKEAGVKTVIDLRLTDHTDRLPALCEKYCMQYFHYPVDTSAETITQMVILFPQLCQLIDAGDFYIACAMGLHRTDIALCAYWLFHGSDKGLPPPEIKGYRQEDGHSLDKLNRVLNALYTALLISFGEQHEGMTAQNGAAPISQQTFKKRKAVIAGQAQK